MTKNQALIEQVAEIIYRHHEGVSPDEYEIVVGKPQRAWKIDAPWDSQPDVELCEHERDEYRFQALAVLAALQCTALETLQCTTALAIEAERAVAKCYLCAGTGRLAADFNFDDVQPPPECGVCTPLRVALATYQTAYQEIRR